MKAAFFLLSILSLLLLGCDKIGPTAGKSTATPATATAKSDQEASAEKGGANDDGHNALFSSEDEASKARREKARKSLGFGR